MRVEIHNKDFQNWIKGILALNTTRDALLDTLREKLGTYVLKYEKADIQKYAYCLEINHNIQFKTKKRPGKRREKVEKRTYTCEHKQCKELFDVFVDKHKGIQKENFKWDLKINEDNTDEENRVETDTNEHEITEENTNKEERVGENTNEFELTEGKTDILWPISRLYMFDEGEHVAKYKGFDNLDISNLIKIMTSCAICEVDGDIELYKKLEEDQPVLQEAVKAKQIVGDIDAAEPNQEIKTITQREPTDISKILVGNPRDFKVLVQNCIEKKRKALKLDVALRSQEENAGHEIEQLQKLQREIEQDWNDINAELTKTEEEDLANLLECLREENTTLKTEGDKAFQNNAELNRINESLRRDIESKVQLKEEEIDSLKTQLAKKEFEVQLKEEEIDRLKRQLRDKELELCRLCDTEYSLANQPRQPEDAVEQYGCG